MPSNIKLPRRQHETKRADSLVDVMFHVVPDQTRGRIGLFLQLATGSIEQPAAVHIVLEKQV